MNNDGMQGWKIAGIAALGVIVLSVPAYVAREMGRDTGKAPASMAEAAFVGIFPHLMGSPVNIAAFVQWDAATPNFVLHENLVSSDRFNDIVDNPPERQGGYITVPNRPGIGLDIVEEKLADYPYRPQRITGHFQADGAVAH